MENKKDLFTRDKIKKDVKNSSMYNIAYAAYITSFYILLPSIVLLIMCLKGDGITYKVLSFAALATLVSAITYFIERTHKEFKKIKTVNNDNFEIIVDTIHDIKEKDSYFDTNHSGITYYMNKSYRLVFSKGEYYVPQCKNYKWSNLHCMTDKDVYNYAKIGDKYFLAVEKNNTILSAYMVDLFEFYDEQNSIN